MPIFDRAEWTYGPPVHWRRAGEGMSLCRGLGEGTCPFLGTRSGHVAAVFHDSGYVYVVSMHVYRPYDSRQQVTGLVRRMVAGLVPLEPR